MALLGRGLRFVYLNFNLCRLFISSNSLIMIMGSIFLLYHFTYVIDTLTTARTVCILSFIYRYIKQNSRFQIGYVYSINTIILSNLSCPANIWQR